MGFLGFHHIGTFLLFVSFILLLIACISSPVTTGNIAMLKLQVTNGDAQTFGVLGDCYRKYSGALSYCSPKEYGYDIAAIIARTYDINFVSPSLHAATKALMLHFVACGMVFISFIIAALSSSVGFFFAAIAGMLSFVVVLATFILDIAIFSNVRSQVNASANIPAIAVYGAGFYCTLVAFILTFFGSVMTCFSCFTDRKHRRRANGVAGGEKY